MTTPANASAEPRVLRAAGADAGVTTLPALDTAILIPCHNEAHSITRVIRDFAAAMPAARIFVYDNCSTDQTAELARSAGAIVRSEPWPGKGNVVRRMFADIDADVYIMADGDGTYDASMAVRLVECLVHEHLDMVVGTRSAIYSNAHRQGHGIGNRVFNGAYRTLFGPLFSDVFSGYRAFSYRFVKSFPAVSSGFEIETEMSVFASQLRMPIAEIETKYGERDAGSQSKLHTVRDALKISLTFMILFKEIHPARFFGGISLVLATSALILAYPLLTTYLATGLVPRLPTGVLATGVVLLAAISLVSGLILDSVARGRLEQKRLHYLGIAHLRRWRDY